MPIKISVIVAVYNPGSHIEDLLASLAAQTMPADQFEVIFVDDDSTDGTRERLQALAEQRSNTVVFHNTPNSGWPGRPRNIGIDAARGKYVIFVDNDDWLPPEALQHLWDYAEANGSDVVVGKEVGHGHMIAWPTFVRSIPHARVGVDPLLRVLTPHKLFRRGLLDEHGIRFPEGRVRLEDHLFVLRAYFAADVVSIYADHPCYHWVRRDAGNASSHANDPYLYYGRDIANILDVVNANVEAAARPALYAHWYRGKMLSRFGGAAFVDASDDHRAKLFDAIHQLTLARFPVAVDAYLDPRLRLRSELLRRGRLDLLVELARAEKGTTAAPHPITIEWQDGRLRVVVRSRLEFADGSAVRFTTTNGSVRRQLPPALDGVDLPAEVLDVTDAIGRTTIDLLLRDRATMELRQLGAPMTVELPPEGPGGELFATVTADIDPAAVPGRRGSGTQITDVLVRFHSCGWGSERRVPFAAADTVPDIGAAHIVNGRQVVAYATEGHGNLSLRQRDLPLAARVLAPSPAPTGRDARRAARSPGYARRLARRLLRPVRE